MDKNIKYGILILAGGVGVYLIYKGGYFQQWFPSLFGPSTPTKPATTPSTPTTITTTPKTPALTQPPVTTPTGYPPAGTLSYSNGATFQADGKGGWVMIQAAPNTTCPPGLQHQNSNDPTSPCVPLHPASLPNNCDTNTPGWSYQNGECLETPAVQTISEKMVAAAGMSDGLNMDQWCYYYTQVTGNACPRDPGEIIAAAGDNPPSFPQGRDTLMDVNTWLAFMNQDGAGLTGIGLAALHVANAWLT
jgi:hypothetical protein